METGKKTVQIPSQGIIDRIGALSKVNADVSTFRGLSPVGIATSIIMNFEGVVSLDISRATEVEVANFKAANAILREEDFPEVVLIGTTDAEKIITNEICRDITGEIVQHGCVRFRKFVEAVLSRDPSAFIEEFDRFTVPNNKGNKGVDELEYWKNLGLGDVSNPDVSRRRGEVKEKLIRPVVERLREDFKKKVLGQLPKNNVLKTEDEQMDGLVLSMGSNATRGKFYQHRDAAKVYGLRAKAVEIFDNETEEEEAAV